MKASLATSSSARALRQRHSSTKRTALRTIRAQAGDSSRPSVNASNASKTIRKRVTRLRDLVEISPNQWEEYSDHSPGSISELGSKQGQLFKEMLLDSPHFRVYSYNVLPSGEHSVKFLMGSPRMDSLDDVSRVTTVVADAGERFINLVPETNGSGFVAEIRFPLQDFEVPTKKNEAIYPSQIRRRRLTALVQARA